MVLMSVVLAVLMQTEPVAQAGRADRGRRVRRPGPTGGGRRGLAVVARSCQRRESHAGPDDLRPAGRVRLAMPAAGKKGAGIAFPTVWADRPGGFDRRRGGEVGRSPYRGFRGGRPVTARAVGPGHYFPVK